MEQNDQLTTVHDSLHEAASAVTAGDPPVDEGPMTTFTFRIPESLKKDAVAHCERHGTTFGGYLRKVTENLLADYKR